MYWGYYFNTTTNPLADFTAETFDHATVEQFIFGISAAFDATLGPAYIERVKKHGVKLWVQLQPPSISWTPWSLGGDLEDVRRAMLNPMTSRFREYVEHTRATLESMGLLDNVAAVGVCEELMNHLRAGTFDHWPELKGRPHFEKANLLQLGWTRLYDEVRRVYPDKFTIALDGAWSDDTKLGRYYLPPPRVDFLALDSYIYPQQPVSQETFDRSVRRVWDHCLERFPNQLVVVGHAFRAGTPQPGEMWQFMPTVEQMQMYVEAARARPRIAALLWFLWGNQDGVEGVRNYPDRVAYLRAEGLKEKATL